MGKPRSDGQVTITISLSEDLVAGLDDCRGSEARSAFLRKALAEKLKAMGLAVSAAAVQAPDRAGKGGRKKRRERSMVQTQRQMMQGMVLAEEPVSYGSPPKKRSSKKKP